MQRTVILAMTLLAACTSPTESPTGPGCPECPECEPVHRAALWKVYIRGFPGFPVGTRFLTAEFDGMALCEEIAAMYNTKPSVVAAGALRFQCEPPQ